MLEKLRPDTLKELLGRFCDRIMSLPQLKTREIILFGSYARGDADEESDVDIMILTDLPREDISPYQDYLVRISTELGLEYGPVVSAIMQNKDFFIKWAGTLPFYQSVRSEGITIDVQRNKQLHCLNRQTSLCLISGHI